MTATPERERRGRHVAATPFVSAFIVVLLGGLLYLTARSGKAAADLVDHTHHVIEENDALLSRLVDAETGNRGFVITGDTSYLDPYRGANVDIEKHLAILRGLTRDSPSQQRRLDALSAIASHRLATLNVGIAARRTSGFDAGREVIVQRGGKAQMDSARDIIAHIDDEERRLLMARTTMQAQRDRVIVIIAVIGTIVAAAIAFILNAQLSRAAATQARLATELRDRAAELEASNRELQDQAGEMEEQASEMEALTEELQSTNEQLEERTAEAEAANRAKAQFLANMSHDLRTPLNAVVGYVDLLQVGIHGPVTEEQGAVLKRIERSSRHLRMLIEDALDFAKIEAGRLRLHIEEIPLSQVLETVGPIVAPQAESKGLAVTYECEDGLPVCADREKLTQILVNLLGNAIKFTERQGRVAVSCRMANDRARIDVSDTGQGIPAESIEAVFQPFVQLEPRQEPRQQGAGLGLAISRELARAMGGDLVVSSTVGVGSTFSLYLPLADVDSEQRVRV